MVVAMGSLIRLVAILCSATVVLGFTLFAVDELDRGSQNQQNALASQLDAGGAEATVISPAPSEERLREESNGSLREAVDDSNDVLLGPFVKVIDSDNTWVENGVPTILGLLLYGLLLGVVANVLPEQRQRGRDWRAA